MKLLRLVIALVLICSAAANAQQSSKLCIQGTGSSCTPVSSTNPLPITVTGGTSAASSIAGYAAFYTATGAIGGVAPAAARANLTAAYDSVSSRAPNNNDDVSFGYAAGNFWNSGAAQYVANATGDGTASWQKLTATSSYIGGVAGTPAACYGTYKMKHGYVGNAFQVTEFTDSSTLNVGFAAKTIFPIGRQIEVADWEAVDNFCSGKTCGLSVWNEQCSGSAYDLVQATQANMPRIYNGTVGSLRAISFDGINGERFMTNADVPITDRRSFTALSLMTLSSSTNNNFPQALFQLDASSTKFMMFMDWPPGGGYIKFSTGVGSTDSTRAVVASPQVMLLVNNAGTLSLSQNNAQSPSLVTGFSASASTGLRLGDTNLVAGWKMTGAMAGFMLWDSALSATNQQNVLQAAYRDTGIAPQAKVNIAIQSNSFVCCEFTGAPEKTFIGQLQTIFNDPIRLVASGVAGVELAELNSRAAVFANSAYVSGMRNIFIVDTGTNNIADSTTVTAAQVLALIQTACGIVKPIGFECWVVSPWPRTSFFLNGQNSAGFETVRQQLLTLEKAAWPSFADGFINAAENQTMGSAASTANTALYTDGTHPAPPVGTAVETSIYVGGLSGVVQ